MQALHPIHPIQANIIMEEHTKICRFSIVKKLEEMVLSVEEKKPPDITPNY